VVDVLLLSLVVDVGLLGELIMSLLLTLVVDTGAASDELLPSGRSAKLLPETARFLIGFIIYYNCCVVLLYKGLLATRRPMLGAP